MQQKTEVDKKNIETQLTQTKKLIYSNWRARRKDQSWSRFFNQMSKVEEPLKRSQITLEKWFLKR